MLSHWEKAADADTEPGRVFRGIKREGQGLYIICFGDHRIRDVSMFVNPNCSGVFSWEHLWEVWGPPGSATLGKP